MSDASFASWYLCVYLCSVVVSGTVSAFLAKDTFDKSGVLRVKDVVPYVVMTFVPVINTIISFVGGVLLLCLLKDRYENTVIFYKKEK